MRRDKPTALGRAPSRRQETRRASVPITLSDSGWSAATLSCHARSAVRRGSEVFGGIDIGPLTWYLADRDYAADDLLSNRSPVWGMTGCAALRSSRYVVGTGPA